MKPDNKETKPLSFESDELVIINNALNEICNGISMGDDEFQTRIGFSRERVRKLLSKVSAATRR